MSLHSLLSSLHLIARSATTLIIRMTCWPCVALRCFALHGSQHEMEGWLNFQKGQKALFDTFEKVMK